MDVSNNTNITGIYLGHGSEFITTLFDGHHGSAFETNISRLYTSNMCYC